MTSPEESLFRYDDGKGHADFNHEEFEPLFLEDADPDLVANATAFCNNNTECIFDLVFTGNRELASGTSSAEEEAATNEAKTGKCRHVVKSG